MRKPEEPQTREDVLYINQLLTAMNDYLSDSGIGSDISENPSPEIASTVSFITLFAQFLYEHMGVNREFTSELTKLQDELLLNRPRAEPQSDTTYALFTFNPIMDSEDSDEALACPPAQCLSNLAAIRGKFEELAHNIDGNVSRKLINIMQNMRLAQITKSLMTLLRCPITKELMKSPVLASDGVIYDEVAITALLMNLKPGDTVWSPVTKTWIKNSTLIPVHRIKSAIDEWRTRHGDSLVDIIPHPQDESALLELFTCPVSQLLMRVPVLASDGNIFEEDSLINHVQRSGQLNSPSSGVVLESENNRLPKVTILAPLVREISLYAAANPSAFDSTAANSMYIPQSYWERFYNAIKFESASSLNDILALEPRLVKISETQAINSGITFKLPQHERRKIGWLHALQTGKLGLLPLLTGEYNLSGILNDPTSLSKFMTELRPNIPNNDLVLVVARAAAILGADKTMDFILTLLPSAPMYSVLLLDCLQHGHGVEHLAIAQKLITAGADISVRDQRGSNLLHLAKTPALTSLVCENLQDYACFTERNRLEESPLYTATSEQLRCLLSFRQKYSDDELSKPMEYAIKRGDIEKIKLLAPLCNSPAAMRVYGNLSMLDIAVIRQKNNNDLLMLLLKSGFCELNRLHGVKRLTPMAKEAGIALRLPLAVGEKPKKFELFVKSLDGRTHTLYCRPNDNIGFFKHLVETKMGPLPGQQRLLFAGKQLEDSLSFEEYNIKRESTLHLVLKLGGD